jgi:LytS/YehU family sensor histidine kinase
VIVVFFLIRITGWLNKKHSWERVPGKRFFLQVILTTIGIILIISIVRTSINLIFTPDKFIRLLDEMVITIFFIFMALLLVFIDIGINLQYKWRYSLAEIERYKRENLKTQFEMLRIQVNPHFLFNSLNTLSSLIYQDQNTASNFVRELSSVYRYILDKRQKEIVKLDEEINFTRSFIYLMQIRFDKKLTFDLRIKEEVKNLQIIPLTLQILIENAVKHNVISSKRPLFIEIKTYDDTIAVRNNLQKKTGKSYSSGIGLDNIRNRLSILTDKKIEVIETDTSFEVRVPLIKSEDIKQKELLN